MKFGNKNKKENKDERIKDDQKSGLTEKDKKKIKGTIFDCMVCHGDNNPVMMHKAEGETGFICSTCEIEKLQKDLDMVKNTVEIAKFHLSKFPGDVEDTPGIGHHEYTVPAVNQWRIEHAKLLNSTANDKIFKSFTALYKIIDIRPKRDEMDEPDNLEVAANFGYHVVDLLKALLGDDY